MDQSPTAQLFAVGDDWQAIFRFAGSDIAVMREFEERFGPGARTDLETTFRCSDGLCKLATRFVLGNPAQIEKRVRTVHGVNGPAVWIDFGGDDAPPSLDEALDRIAADVLATEGRPSVLLLGRYRHLKPDMRRLAPKHPALDLSYRTVHAAKGLESRPTTSWCSASAQAGTGSPPRSPMTRCSTWSLRHPKSTRTRRSAGSSTSR